MIRISTQGRLAAAGRTAALALALGCALPAPAALAQAAPTAARPSPHFEAVRQRLAIGGPLFVYVDIDGDVERIGRDVGQSIAATVGDAPAGAKVKQDYAAILAELGLTQVKAIGMSSAARADGSFENRTFLYIPEPRRGLLAALGGPAKPFATARLAPADTDLFIESELDVPALLETLAAVAKRFGVDEPVAAILDAARAQAPVDPDQLAAAARSAELFAALKGRFTFALGFAPDAKIDPDAPEVSGLALGAKLLVRLEGIGGKVAAIFEGIDELMVETAGPSRVFRTKEPVPFLGDNQPVIAIEGETVTFASSRAHLDANLARTDGLDRAPAFRAGLEATGPEGNSLTYATPRFLQLVKDGIAAAAAANAPGDDVSTAVLQAILGQFPAGDQPFVAVTANLPDGIMFRSRSFAPNKSGLLALGLYNPETIGTIARIAAPALARALIAEPAEPSRAGSDEAPKSAREQAIEANLKRIAEVAERYFAANPNDDEVGFEQLLGLDPSLAALKPVAGEDYGDVTVAKAAGVVEIELPSGMTVAWAAPLSDADRETIRNNLAALDEAAAWYLATRPGEPFMAGEEALADGSPLKEMPAAVRGENYGAVNVSRNADVIRIKVAGETISIERDPALAQKYEEEMARRTELVEENLARIYAAARQAFAKDKDALVVRGRALIGAGKPIPRIELAAGENYENVIVWRNYAAISVEVPGRGRVAHRPEIEGPALETINGNLRAIGRAAGGWFAKNPNERFVVSGELMGGASRPIAKPIVGQLGEDYTDITLGRDFDEIRIKLPSGQAISVERPR